MRNKQNPAVATAGNVGNALAVGKRRDSLSEKPSGQQEYFYFLHLRIVDGVELRLDYEMPRESHRVTVADGFETTITRDLRIGGEDRMVVRPRGRGWVLYDSTNDKWTKWRRPHVAEGAS